MHKPDARLIAGLQALGYRGPLLEENYAFPDWFDQQQERITVAAAFGQTPISYESACVGIIRANGASRQDLVNGFRSLGAPILLEIDDRQIREWAVSRVANRHELIATFDADEVDVAFAQRAHDWKPATLLRAKNIGSFGWERQANLFSGLVPELEGQIQAQLDPLLRRTLAETRDAHVAATGRQPDAEHLFKLVFWTLTAKVFRDRKVQGFSTLSADPDAILAAVARQYRATPPRLLTKEARLTAANLIWQDLDFRNLSVEVLSQIWSTTLVDVDTRRRLGIHRTPRTLVRYIIERVPFSPSGDDQRIVFEPCCGSAAFLIGAMHALRQNLFGASSTERHKYFVNHLAGVEYDPFGAEISALALTLADFPNPNGWKVKTADVFAPGTMTDELRSAGVVLCNQPFEDFTPQERGAYQLVSIKKPAELLHRVLDDLHPDGVLGFVLPVNAIDGQSYAGVRERLAQRFASLEFTVLPDKAFEADAEVALLIATEPIPHDVTQVAYRRVKDDLASWQAFDREHRVSAESSANYRSADARNGFRIPDLPEVWSYLLHYKTLGEVAAVHRGVEWNLPLDPSEKGPGYKDILVRPRPAPGYRLGVPPKAKFNLFERPQLAYLSAKAEHHRGNAWQRDWGRRKAILNKTTKSRGNWRIAAFADQEGLTCYQTFIGVWPKTADYDEVILAAILNSPIANAFVATREGKTDITLEILRLIPMPILLDPQREKLGELVGRYIASLTPPLLGGEFDADGPERLLKEIDAVILDGYRMPPRLEREVLDFFAGEQRPVSHSFSDYFPTDFKVFLSLSEYLDPRITGATVGALVELIESRQA
ncbi:MAG: N-6 DNA methylase [Thermoanaerobaculia bacterium]